VTEQEQPKAATVATVRDGVIWALARAQGTFEQIVKNKTVKVETRDGKEYSYSYADLASVIEATKTSLHTHELAVVTKIIQQERGLTLVTSICHPSGESIDSFYPLPNTTDPKQLGSAITYGRRYCLSGLLNIAAEDDDDGARVEPEPRQRPQNRPPASGPNPVVPKPQPKAPEPNAKQGAVPTKDLAVLFKQLAPKFKWTTEQIQQYMTAAFKISSTRELTRKQYEMLCGIVSAASFTVAMAEVAPPEPDVDMKPPPVENPIKGEPIT
jgi:hypothetical protein